MSSSQFAIFCIILIALFSLRESTETTHAVSSPKVISKTSKAPSSETDCMSEKAQLTPNSGYNETSTSTTSVSHTVSAPLDFINAGHHLSGPNPPHVQDIPNPITEAQKLLNDISIDSQGCILLDKESNDLIPSDKSTGTTINNTEVNVPIPPRQSASIATETTHAVSSPKVVSKTSKAPSSETDCMSEKAQLTPNSGYNETSTSTTSVSHTVSAPLDFINAGSLSPSPAMDLKCETTLGDHGDKIKQLEDFQDDLPGSLLTESSHMSPFRNRSKRFGF
ncbi:hypothetical protein F2Q70_00041651 [Brassica cretica]|uniref:Uncharacterized protein n=1 Tax=Brassica cretica TaxID=69181 RepID=A0A8S9KDS5_BRACR|nr:hypothetical protein F2Q70_00041651 [Brassica cretica]